MKPDNLIPTIEHVTKSIRLVDDLFFYKKTFQDMLGKFYEWTMIFSEQRQPKIFEPPQPTYTTLDELTLQLKASLIQKAGRLPRLFIEKVACPTQTLSRQMVCDVSQMIHLLVAAVLRIAGVDNLEKGFVKLQLYATYLQVDKGAAIDKQDTCLTMYRAIAMVLSNAGTPSDEIPKVKSCYKHVAGSSIERIKRSKAVPHYVDPYKETIESIIDSNYGYLEYPRNHKNAMLLVLPANITSIDNQGAVCTANKDVKTEKTITLREEIDCIIILMQFCDFICRSF